MKFGPLFRLGGITLVAALALPACSPRRATGLREPWKPRWNLAVCQVRSVSRSSPPQSDTVTEVQIAPNGVLHARRTTGDRVELDLVTDGKREFRLNPQGRYEEANGDAATDWTRWQQLCHPDMSEVEQGVAVLLGEEEVGGHLATIYRWTDGENTGQPEQVRVWLANVGLQPLKMERQVQKSFSPSRDTPVTEVTTILYSYDPTVKVVLPAP